jgi:branched-subunit amino acid transport protein
MSMHEFYLISGMAIITFLIRYPVLAISEHIDLSPQMLRLLRHIPPAVLAAIAVPAVFIPNGHDLELSYTNARLVGAIVALGIGWWQNNLLLTIGLGLSAFFGWQWLLAVLSIR